MAWLAGCLAFLALLAAPRRRGRLARPRQGFLLDFLTKAMIWLGPGKAFSWISLPKP